MTGEVRARYSAYSGYFVSEIASVKFVEPMNTARSSTMPATVHCSTDPAATAPKAKITHHCAFSKKKFGCRDSRHSPV
jgi:hypothetical protein